MARSSASALARTLVQDLHAVPVPVSLGRFEEHERNVDQAAARLGCALSLYKELVPFLDVEDLDIQRALDAAWTSVKLEACQYADVTAELNAAC